MPKSDFPVDETSFATGTIGSPRRPTHRNAFFLVCGAVILTFTASSVGFLLGHIVYPTGDIAGKTDGERLNSAAAGDGPIYTLNSKAKRYGRASRKRNAAGSFHGAGPTNKGNGADGSEDEDGSSEVNVSGESGIPAPSTFDLDVRIENEIGTNAAVSEERSRTNFRRSVSQPAIADCPGTNGPQLYVLMTLGRSGSGSTWQIIGNLTGYETPSVELTGNSAQNSRIFFQKHKKSNGRWILSYFCHLQNKYPEAGVVGFKWKPFSTIFSKSARDALKTAASLSSPSIKVVRSRRNPLDVLISRQKHKHGRKNPLLHAHCLKGEEECLREARAVGTGIELPTEDLFKELQGLKYKEDKTDKMLKKLGVPHIQVSYEKMYTDKDPEEWMRIFRFLGRGPQKGLVWTDVEVAMQHVSTSNSFHNVTLKNYEEVRDRLRNSEFFGLLH